MKKTARVFSLLLILSMLLVPTAASAKKDDPPGQLVQLQLLAFNDYHGHVLPNDAGNVDGIPAGGGPRRRVACRRPVRGRLPRRLAGGSTDPADRPAQFSRHPPPRCELRGRPREGDRLPGIPHAADPGKQALEAQRESRVGESPAAGEVEGQAEGFFRKAALPHPSLEEFRVVRPLRPFDQRSPRTGLRNRYSRENRVSRPSCSTTRSSGRGSSRTGCANIGSTTGCCGSTKAGR